MAQHIDSEPEEFRCDLCGEEFDSLSELEDHKKSHKRRPLHEESHDIDRDIGAPGLPTAPIS